MNPTRTLVHSILKHAQAYSWTLQGFGMLRTYLDDKTEWRLNVWDSSVRVPGVSLIHDHPWDFTSLIVSGTLRNIRFHEVGPQAFQYGIIRPGPGGGMIDPKGFLTLGPFATEYYYDGDTYRQNAEEIHLSDPEDGTVTLNQRIRKGEDLARVFWYAGESWVSAEPRKATADEIEMITKKALERF